MLNDLIGMYVKFFRMGAVTFGGGYAMLPILQREIVHKSKWLDEETILDYYALSQGLPGIIAINVSAFIGYHHRRTPGAVAAALGVVSPSILIISIIAFFLSSFQNNIYVQHALAAISVCVVALILDTVLSLWKKSVKDLLGAAICFVILLLSLFTGISPVLMVVCCALIGIVTRSVARAKDGGCNK